MNRKGYNQTGILIGVVALVSACGAGTATTQKEFGVFSGKTTAATITTENAKNIASSGLSGVNETNQVDGFSLVMKDKARALRKPHLKQKSSARASEETGSNVLLADLLQGLTTKGDCGGTMTMKMDDSESMQMSITYDQYCERVGEGENDTQVQNGHMSMTTSSDSEYKFDIDITMKSPTENSVMRAVMNMKELEDDSTEIQMDMEISDSVADESLKLENVRIRETSDSFAFAGRIYNDDDGFVEVETLQEIKTDAQGVPFEGKMVIKGDNNSSATLEIVGENYSLTVDEDGDGTADSTVSGKSMELAEDASDEENNEASNNDGDSENDDNSESDTNEEESANVEDGVDEGDVLVKPRSRS